MSYCRGPKSGYKILLRSVALDPVAVGAQELQVLDVVLTAATGDDVVNLQDAERELAAAVIAPALLLAKEDMLVLAVGHGASMSVRLGMSVRAVTSRLWNRSLMDCCGRILTSSTALGDMSTPIHRQPKFSVATHAVAQPQAQGASQKGQAQKTFFYFSPTQTPGRHRAGRVAVARP